MSVTDKSVLITGSSGFIGSSFLKQIIPLNPKNIQLLDTQPPQREQVKLINEGKVKFIQCDIRDIEEFQHNIEPVDTIIHFAAQPSVPVSTSHPYYDFSVNVEGSMRMLEYARKTGIEHFVFAASGGTIYGETDVLPTPETQYLNPISNYGAAKAAFEMYLRSYTSLYGFKTTSLRFGNIFGPGSTHGVIFDFFQKLRRDKSRLKILGDGSQTKSYLYIGDCIDGFLRATNRDDDGFQAFNLSSKVSISVRQIAEIIAKILEINPVFEFTGEDRGWKGDVRYGSLDTSKILALGWSNKTSFEDGVKSYINWLREIYGW